MEKVRLTILSATEDMCCHLDNDAPDALHYYDDELHEYLEGNAYTYSFTCSAKHNDSQYMVEGGKVSFIYREKPYYLNIMQVVRTEYEVEVTAYGLSLELLNEYVGAYSGTSMTFVQYIEAFNFADNLLTIGVNEVSSSKISNEWTGEATVLARLYSLANVFSAEIEFVAELNLDGSLKQLTLNVYEEYDEDAGTQGVGQRRDDINLRYGVDVTGVTKKSDITDLYTAIRPTGKDDLTITSLDKSEYDSDGNLLYSSPKGTKEILAVQAMEQFPSNLMENVTDRYIAYNWSYDTDNVNTLYGQALAQLKKYCVPQVTYDISGYFDTDIGDTVMVIDEEYTPHLYLRARVTEQVRSFTDPTKCKTVFSNVVEKESEIDDSLLSQMQALIDAKKVYTVNITSDNGVVFKNGAGDTTLLATVRDDGANVTENFSLKWYRDDEYFTTSQIITVYAETIEEKAVYRVEAVDSVGVTRGVAEVTVSCVDDGEATSIVSNQVLYQYNDSGEVAPSGSWSETVPAVEYGKYLWTLTIVSYSDGTMTSSYSVSRIGEDGAEGNSFVWNLCEGTSDAWQSYAVTDKNDDNALHVLNFTGMNDSSLSVGDRIYVAMDIKFSEDFTATGTGTNAMFLQGSENSGGDWVSISMTGGNLKSTLMDAASNRAEIHIVTYFDVTSAMIDGTYSGVWFVDFRFDYYSGTIYYKCAMASVGEEVTWAPHPSDLIGEDGEAGTMLYATCTTAATTAAKVATLKSGTLTLTAGATVAVNFAYENTASSPTLNVNSTGAKTIYTQGVKYAYWNAGATVLFTYDGSYWRVSSEPVYASTVTVGNSAGRHIYIDDDSLDINDGSTTIASFVGRAISTGNQTYINAIGSLGGLKLTAGNETDGAGPVYMTLPDYKGDAATAGIALLPIDKSCTSAKAWIEANYIEKYAAYEEFSGYYLASYSDIAFKHKHSTSGKQVSFGVGSGGNNRGIYDDTAGKWIVYKDKADLLILNEDTVQLGSSSKYYCTSKGDLYEEVVYSAALELSYSTPFIDFHFGKSTADYTSRIIEKSSGALTAVNSITNSSDRRLKKDIEDMPQCYVDMLNSLRPVQFRYIKTPDLLYLGLIAQEVDDALAEQGITESGEKPIIDNGNGEPLPGDEEAYWSLDYSQITTILVGGYQAQAKKIEEMQETIDSLEERIKALEALLINSDSK